MVSLPSPHILLPKDVAHSANALISLLDELKITSRKRLRSEAPRGIPFSSGHGIVLTYGTLGLGDRALVLAYVRPEEKLGSVLEGRIGIESPQSEVILKCVTRLSGYVPRGEVYAGNIYQDKQFTHNGFTNVVAELQRLRTLT